MKKFLAAALALCMTSAALTSCGDSNSSSAADSNSAAANSQASDSSAADTESVSDKLLAEYPASTEKIDVKNGATENMMFTILWKKLLCKKALSTRATLPVLRLSSTTLCKILRRQQRSVSSATLSRQVRVLTPQLISM